MTLPAIPGLDAVMADLEMIETARARDLAAELVAVDRLRRGAADRVEAARRELAELETRDRALRERLHAAMTRAGLEGVEVPGAVVRAVAGTLRREGEGFAVSRAPHLRIDRLTDGAVQIPLPIGSAA